MPPHIYIDAVDRSNEGTGFTYYQIESMVARKLKKLVRTDRRDKVTMMIDFLEDPIPVRRKPLVGLRYWNETEIDFLSRILADMFGLSLGEVRRLQSQKHGSKLDIRKGPLKGWYSLFVSSWPQGNGRVMVFVVARTPLDPDELPQP